MFTSLMFPSGDVTAVSAADDFIKDINLNKIIEVCSNADKMLYRFYLKPLKSLCDIKFRHDVWRDLENPSLRDAFRCFVSGMSKVREELAKKNLLHNSYQRKNSILDSALIYIDEIKQFYNSLSVIKCTSSGVRSFCESFFEYAHSSVFTEFEKQTRELRNELYSISYSVRLRQASFHVGHAKEANDFSAEINNFFSRFRTNDKKTYARYFNSAEEMNSAEAVIIEYVGRHNPDIFAKLDVFSENYSQFIPDFIETFELEARFLLSWIDYTLELRGHGCSFCLPKLSTEHKRENVVGMYDLALAKSLVSLDKRVVTNDYQLNEGERGFVVTGPNQGGKTTFARAFGQLHYIASLGLPVPADKAELFLQTDIFTHFEKDDDAKSGNGKLLDDLIRAKTLLESASTSSIIIINEIFNSTTLSDAVLLGGEIMKRIEELDCIYMFVTFLYELAERKGGCVSLVGGINDDANSERTFILTRKPADGKAFASVIAKKYGLDYHGIMERMK